MAKALHARRVRLIANHGVVDQLLRSLGPDILLALIEHGHLEISYLQNNLGIYTEGTGTSQERHLATAYELPSWNLQEVAPNLFQQVTGKSGKGRRLGLKFARLVHPISYDATEIRAAADTDFSNGDYVSKAVAEMLKRFAPEYQPEGPLIFRIQPIGDRLTVETNIDFHKANESHHKHYPVTVSSLSPAIFLSYVMDVSGVLHHASLYGAEIATGDNISALLRIKCSDLLSARLRNQGIVDVFQDRTLPNAHSIREAVNAGERTWREVLDLLDSAVRFRTWLQKQEPDIDLVDAYYREVTKSTWVEKLPTKVMRWAFLAIAGVVLELKGAGVGGVAATGIAGAADSLLVDKLARGWRPNQFVDTGLREFLSPK